MWGIWWLPDKGWCLLEGGWSNFETPQEGTPRPFATKEEAQRYMNSHFHSCEPRLLSKAVGAVVIEVTIDSDPVWTGDKR